MTRTRAALNAALLSIQILSITVTACGPLGGGGSSQNSTPENTAPPVDALEDPRHPGIEACATGKSAAEINDTLAIASAFKQSCHEMIVCGGLSASFSTSLINVLINSASGDPTQPSGFIFDGQGTYAAGTQMVISLHLGADTSFGKKGDVITFDVFDINNYFTGAVIKATASIDTSGNTKTSIGIEFQNPGPGVELLGLGPSPKSPLTVDFDAIAAAVGKIQMTNIVTVDDTQGDEATASHIVYKLNSPPVEIGSIFNGGSLPMELVETSGSRTSTGQTITVTDWAMIYQSGSSGTMDGSIHFDVKGGGAFPYSATFTYPHRKAPDVSLACIAQ